MWSWTALAFQWGVFKYSPSPANLISGIINSMNLAPVPERCVSIGITCLGFYDSNLLVHIGFPKGWRTLSYTRSANMYITPFRSIIHNLPYRVQCNPSSHRYRDKNVIILVWKGRSQNSLMEYTIAFRRLSELIWHCHLQIQVHYYTQPMIVVYNVSNNNWKSWCVVAIREDQWQHSFVDSFHWTLSCQLMSDTCPIRLSIDYL